MTRRERHLHNVLQEFPFLWAINNLWFPDCTPTVVTPTKEIFSEPFPRRAEHSGNVSVWLHLTIPDLGPRTYPGAMERIICPSFTPHPTESLGKVIYDHYVLSPEDPDDWDGRLETVILAEGQPLINDCERLLIAPRITVYPSRRKAAMHDLLLEWFG